MTDTHIPEIRHLIKLSAKLGLRDLISNGNMTMTVFQQFGDFVTLKRVDNIASLFPRMNWRVFTDGQWYKRDDLGDWELIKGEKE